MNCRKCKTSLLPHIDGTLDRETSQALQQHLAHCEKCASLLLAMQTALSAAPPRIPVPPGFLAQIRRRLQPSSAVVSVLERLQQAVVPLVRPAVAMLLLVASTYLGKWLAAEEPATSPDTTSEQVLQYADQIEELTLESESSLVGVYLSLQEN